MESDSAPRPEPGAHEESAGEPPSTTPPPLPESGAEQSSITPPPLPGAAAPVFQGKLHPLSILFVFWNVIRGFIIPLGLLWLLGRESILGGFILIFVVIPVIVSIIRYATFRYRIADGELITRQGVFSRTERNIPLSRIQDIRIDQGVLHRLLRMADVHVDTAGGQGAEASMSVLAKQDAERLRAAVIQHKANQAGFTAAPDSPASANPEPEVIWQCRLRDLIVAGMTSNHLASALAIIAVVWGLLDDIIPREAYEKTIQSSAQSAELWLQQEGERAWLVFAAGAVALLLVGMLFSVAGTVLLFFGFKLSRTGEDLHRSYGLLTRRTSNLPRRRIQVLKIEEKLFRRWFGLATLRADRAGGGPQAQASESKAGRDVLLPIIRTNAVENLLPVFFPGLDPAASQWRRVSRKAIRRGTYVGSVICLLLTTILVAIERDWFALWPLSLLPAVYWLNVMSYKHLGFWQSDQYFRTRRGWLSRSGHVVPIRNIQSVIIHQNPFDRRHRVATLTVDTAGQAYTGGGPQISNVPASEIDDIAWNLARRAEATRYRW